MGQHVRRGVGYCLNADCVEHFKGVFLLNPSSMGHYRCGACDQVGRLVLEETRIQPPARSPLTGPPRYYRVVVEFNYDPEVSRFRGTAIVLDHDCPEGGQYILRSPLVKTEKRALMLAEQALGNLNLGLPANKPQANIDLDLPRERFAEAVRQVVARR